MPPSMAAAYCKMSTTHTTRILFVTVGTTRFDALVIAVTRSEVLNWLHEVLGVTDLVIQYGTGQQPQLPTVDSHKLSVRFYDFQPTLIQDMQEADLIVSHAGAGTTSEALRLRKKLAVVINTALMDNHQTELAHAMGKRGHLFVVDDPSELHEMKTWERIKAFTPVPHIAGDENEFASLLDRFMVFEA